MTGSPTAFAASYTPVRATPFVLAGEKNSRSCSRSTTCTRSATPEAFSYSIAAAERAKSVYANVEAAEFYERALLAGRRLDQLTRAELAEVHEALGDARNRAGAYVEAAAAYRSARRLVEDDALAEARLALKLARVQAWLDRYASVLRWITKGLNILKGNPSAEAARQRAELLAWYGRCCQDEGRHQRALRWSTLAVAEAEAVGHKEALADALRFIDYAKMELGQLEEPANWVRALALFEELENLPGQSGVLNMLGMFAYFRGEWDKALELYKRAQVTVHRTGNAVMDAIYVLNIGEIFLDQGRLDEAEQRFHYSSRVFRAARYRTGMAYLNINIARLAARQGRYEDALGIFEESLAESRKVGAHEKLLEATARKAECLLLSDEVTAALAVADEGLVQARSLGGVPAQIPLLQRVRGVALARMDRRDGARRALEESLSAARGAVPSTRLRSAHSSWPSSASMQTQSIVKSYGAGQRRPCPSLASSLHRTCLAQETRCRPAPTFGRS